MKRLHVLKSHPDSFSAVRRGDKTHEIRDTSDRDFRDGDLILLREWDDDLKEYTGPNVLVTVSHVTPGGTWGLPTDRCVMSIEVIPPIEPEPLATLEF